MRIRLDNMSLSFDDVLMIPRLGVLNSRGDADISSWVVPGMKVDVPIVSAPMNAVTEWEMAKAMWTHGGLGFIHRAMKIEKQVEQYNNVVGDPSDGNYDDCGCAIGVDEGNSRIDALYQAGCRLFVIDVAHGHSVKVRNVLKGFIDEYGWDSQFIVGSVATGEAARYFMQIGVDALRVGIGGGAACTTRTVTGHGVPLLTSIDDIAEAREQENVDIKIMADGGIRNSGDIVKALATGADTVMIGRLLAGCPESPFPGLYYGQASNKAREATGQYHHAPEGVVGTVDHEESVEKVIKNLAWGIRSGLSYAGATNLDELRGNAEFTIVSSNSLEESQTRI